MLSALYPVIILLIGLLLYAFASTDAPRVKAAKIGIIMFACGMGVVTWVLGSHMVTLLR